MQKKSSPNSQQQRVIKQTEGPILVIAGPGSGKTFTLVERILHIIKNKNIKPENLLVATFTEKAAKELVTRISNSLLAEKITFNVNEMYIGTLHSIWLRLLEENRELTRLKRNYTLMDQFDQQYFIYQRMKEYDTIENIKLIDGIVTQSGKEKSRWDRTEILVKWINRLSEEAVDISKMSKDKEPAIVALANCYHLYQRHISDANALDFSTIQYEALQMLNTYPSVVKKLQEQLAYIMIDEYQDTNTIQETILLKLIGNNENICVVGDDDQGLYRFRGATIRNILEFPQNFPKGKCVQEKLTINYRSHPEIVTFYNQWMQTLNWSHGGTTFRYDKQIVARNGEFPKLPTVIKVAGESGMDNWCQEVLEFLKEMKKSTLSDWNQVAFLFKSVKNERAVELANFLEKNHIPVYSPRSDQFFDREEIRLVIGALLYLFPQYRLVRQWDSNIHMNIWDYYDGCQAEFAEQLQKAANQELLKWCDKRAHEHEGMTKNADYSFSGLFYQFFQFPLFNRFMDEKLSDNVIDGRPIRNIAIFTNLLGKFEYLHHITVLTEKYLGKNLTDLFNQFFRYLKDGGIDEYEDESEYAPSGCVSFLTIHQSKGLEFPVVVVGSLGDIPKKSYSNLDVILQQRYYSKRPFEPLDEMKNYDFWRLYYTAFSRAQNLLVLSCQEKIPENKRQWPVPSKQIAAVYSSIPSWRAPSFKPSLLELEKVKDVNIKQEYSFTSHILLYEACARQYRFFKELGFTPVRQSPILFGTLVHETIEDVHKAVLRGQENLVTTTQIADWFQDNYANLTKKERVYLAEPQKNAALDHVMRYVDAQSQSWDKIREAEVDVSLVKDSYILTGKIDLLRGVGNTVEIIDFKTEKKPQLTEDVESLERYKRQLEIYAHVVEQRLNLEVSKMHLYYTGDVSGEPMISFSKNNDTIDQTIGVIDQTVSRIENRNFHIANRPIKYCVDCDIRHYCNTCFKKKVE